MEGWGFRQCFLTNSWAWMDLGKFYHDRDLTVLPNPGIMVSKGNHPQMAELFRLVKYDNLPRWIIGLSTGYLRLATIEGVMTWQRKPTTCSWFLQVSDDMAAETNHLRLIFTGSYGLKPAGGKPYQRFASFFFLWCCPAFFWEWFGGGGLCEGWKGGRNNVFSIVILFRRSWWYALNLFLALPTRSGCYALNFFM